MKDLVDVHFYDEITGLFTNHLAFSASCLDRMVEANTLPGHKAFIGDADPLSQKIDTSTGALVENRPTRPSDDHHWHPLMRQWVKRPEVQQREFQIADTKRRMLELEQKQARIDRDLRLRPNSVGADGKTPQQRLESLDAELERLRAIVSGETETTAP